MFALETLIPRFLPTLSLRRLMDAVIDADRDYRERRRLERLEYPYLRDMGIDLGRSRETRRDRSA